MILGESKSNTKVPGHGENSLVDEIVSSGPGVTKEKRTILGPKRLIGEMN